MVVGDVPVGCVLCYLGTLPIGAEELARIRDAQLVATMHAP